jgi:hypothetical protein
MTEDTLYDVVTATSAKEVWDSLQTRFASSTRARTLQVRVELATSNKLDLTAADYFCKIKGLATEMVAADALLRDDEVIAYLLAGLPVEYDPFVTSMTTKGDSLLLDDVYAYLMAFEARQLTHQTTHQLALGSSANYVSRGGRGDRSRGGNRGRGRGCGGPPPRTNDNRGRGSNARPPCHICGKVGHTAIRCWHRNDDIYNTDPPSTAVAHTSSYTIDPNWYVDTGATDHINNDLDRLALRERYHGGEQFQVGNGAGLQILHTGHSTINSDHRPLTLRNILHVPDISKNLLSVQKFSRDNDVFFEFHPSYFSIKDRWTRRRLLEGRCKGGLYPIPFSDDRILKHALISRPISRDDWHARLGHPSSQVVHSILHLNKITCTKQLESVICNACQLAKSHQLPYNSSIHRSTCPLEVLSSDVWGPAPTSVGGYKYYISFIDDFIKFS